MDLTPFYQETTAYHNTMKLIGSPPLCTNRLRMSFMHCAANAFAETIDHAARALLALLHEKDPRCHISLARGAFAACLISCHGVYQPKNAKELAIHAEMVLDTTFDTWKKNQIRILNETVDKARRQIYEKVRKTQEGHRTFKPWEWEESILPLEKEVKEILSQLKNDYPRSPKNRKYTCLKESGHSIEAAITKINSRWLLSSGVVT